MHERTLQRPRERLRGVSWLLLDLLIIYLTFVGALKIRLGTWEFLLHETMWGLSILITMASYLVALIFSGLYRMHPRGMHLDSFLKVAMSLLIGWAGSLTLIYLAVPTSMPPRSVTAAQCMFSIIGILGIRALGRYTYERNGTSSGSPSPLPVIRVEELLNRPPLQIDLTGLRNYLSGRTVLVTGAGGSIGAILSRQLLDLTPFRLVLVDVSEFNLYHLENELRGLPFKGELIFRIADVRDDPVMHSLFSSLRPDVVFHAAAYKHVPLMERHPAEAFRNNTLTTVGLVRLCETYGTEQFILISTDKAVNPTSVLGATKRLAEWYVRTVNAPMQCKTVRFGNVLMSQGSVIPLFMEQIAHGGPVTVTDPAMDRYFMSAHEACCLILQSLLLDAAPVYTLEMGTPVRIQWLAEQLIRRLAPYQAKRIKIVYSGIRPGEKLHEALWDKDETPVPTTHDEIVGLQSQAPFSRLELDTYFSSLEQLCIQNRAEELRKALFQKNLQPIDRSLQD